MHLGLVPLRSPVRSHKSTDRIALAGHPVTAAAWTDNCSGAPWRGLSAFGYVR